MPSVKNISPYQFAAFRIVFGVYLMIHFAGLLPYGTELFSNQGVLADPHLNFTHGILPNPLELWGSPAQVTAFLAAMILLSSFFTVGLLRRTSALLLWFGWACLFNRNNLISNPSIPYVGLLLILCALVPAGEPLSFRKSKSESTWYLPWGIYAVAWILMAAGYTFSGCIKLSSPSWIDGTALTHLLNNPLARPGAFRDLFLALPELAAKMMTWGVLALEILFLPLCVHRRTRLFAWLSMVIMHAGILLMVNFADLSFGMLMIHFFTFDPNWLPARGRANQQPLVLFDGKCGLCDQTVQFLLDEDRNATLAFAPLQGETASAILRRQGAVDDPLGSVVYVRDHKVIRRSQAILMILSDLGGFWRLVSWLRIVPLTLRDAVYDWVARHRYEWFGQHAECILPSPAVKARFLP